MSTVQAIPSRSKGLTTFLNILLLGGLALQFIFPGLLTLTFSHLQFNLVSLGYLLVLMLCFIIFISRKKAEINISPLSKSLLVFGLLILIVTFITGQGFPQENWLGLAGQLLFLALLPPLVSPLLNQKNPKLIINFLNFLAIALSLLAASQLLVTIFPQLFWLQLPSFLQAAINPLNLLVLILICLTALISFYLKKGRIVRPYNFFLPFLVIGLLCSIFFLISPLPANSSLSTVSDQRPWLNNFQLNFQTAVNYFTSAEVPLLNKLFGQGSQSFSDVFATHQPSWTNQTAWGNASYQSGLGAFFTLWVTFGPIIALAWLVITFLVLKRAWQAIHPTSQTSSHSFNLLPAVLIFCLLFLPLTSPLHYLLIVLMAYALNFDTPQVISLSINKDKSTKNTKNQLVIKTPKILYYGGCCLLIGGTLYLTINFIRAAFALELSTQLQQQTLSISDADPTYFATQLQHQYQLSQKIAQLAPHLDLVHRQVASQALALTLYQDNLTRTQPNSANSSLAAYNQQQELIAVTLTAAQKALAIRPNRSQNWLFYGEVQQELFPLRTDADPNQVINTFLEGLALDPYNINYHLHLGSFYLDQHQPSLAQTYFQTAIETSPNQPLGYYHLAQALVVQGDREAAYQAYQQTFNLLNPSSPSFNQDSQLLQAEISQLNYSPLGN